jgi:hypothetical protein
MIIILEGSDGAGKTTLAARLKARMPDAIELHSGPLRSDPFTEYEERLADWDGVTPIIADRWHIGELVYGPIFRGESKLDVVGRWHIDAFLVARGAMVVYLCPPLELIADRVAARGDDMVDVTHLPAIYDTYETAISSDVMPTMHVGCTDPENCTGHDHKIPLVEEIVEDAYSRWLHTNHLRRFTTYIGSSAPDYLILGERRNDPEAYHAAFVPTGATSGRFMLEHLLPVLGSETSIGIANACEEDVYELWCSLARPPIVALGNAAYEAACRSLHERGLTGRVPLGAVPHPQYIRRFHNKSGALYARTIISALNTGEDLRSWRPA